jgi:hypothetical protein
MNPSTLLIHLNEQDDAEARTWVREHIDNGGVVAVWLAIQAMPDDGIPGIISRLAQLQLGKLWEEYLQETQVGGGGEGKGGDS